MKESSPQVRKASSQWKVVLNIVSQWSPSWLTQIGGGKTSDCCGMEKLKVPKYFTNYCKEIYSNSRQCIRTKNGLTRPIQISNGIKQGFPLSPLLFNISLEAILPLLHQKASGQTFEKWNKGDTKSFC